MLTRKVTVENEHGVHARVALRIVERCQRGDCRVTICKGCEKADGCSILQLLLLGATKGSEVEVTVEGGDEGKVIAAIAEVFTEGSGI